VSDSDQAMTWRRKTDDDLSADLSAYEDSVYVDGNSSGDPTTRLVSFEFIIAAIRRGRRLWGILAVVGLLLGCALLVDTPPVYKATVSVLLTEGADQNPQDEIQTDQALAQSLPVAADVIGQLGLQQTPTHFLGTYTVTQVTDRVLMFTVSSTSSAEAVRIASALATQYLNFRAQYAQAQQQLTESALNTQVTQAQQHLNSINSKIKQISAQPSSSGTQAELAGLHTQSAAASASLTEVQQYVTGTLASTRTATQTMVRGSQVLNSAVAIPVSRKKTAILYVAGGVFGGLVLGLAIVVIGAITTDRLLRRDDIAYAIGAPVGLSVGPLRKKRWFPSRPGKDKNRRRDTDRLARYLQGAVPGSAQGPACLAIVAVDDARAVAQAVIALAVSRAKRGDRVVLADLSAGSYAARSLGTVGSGNSMTDVDGTRIMVIVPADDDIAPAGPLHLPDSPKETIDGKDSLAAAFARADLVLSMVTLDPATGGEHLATWSTDAVAVVTVGKSNATRLHAVSEMIRFAGVRLQSVVVVGADGSDQSLGMASVPYQSAQI
jgi:hypothetical protein